jgi:hypothetical protein
VADDLGRPFSIRRQAWSSIFVWPEPLGESRFVCAGLKFVLIQPELELGFRIVDAELLTRA